MNINPLSGIWFVKISSKSVGSHCILLIIYFAVQKLLSLMYSLLLIFICIDCAFDVISKISLARPISLGFVYVFFTSVMVLGLMFKFLIHFELIFVNGVRKGSNFIVLHVFLQFSQHHLLKRLCFPHWVFLVPLLNIS